MKHDGIKIRGHVLVEVHDAETGALRYAFEQPNLITDVGLDQVADFLITSVTGGTPPTLPTHMAVGTDDTAPAAGDTALGAEVYRGSIVQATSTSGVVTFKMLIGAGSANGSDLEEAGLFNASSSGDLFAHTLFTSTVSKTSSDTVTITWTITLTDN